ncbi:hypothetical protein [Photobacterium kishitanii]|uniref:Uncharacterized protein n=1 Tax=Photobacterium kishitanii TaxID=318456 RepID=A0A2T3KB08_9GAMM|nr:hypothetical protein [Photobacterium kishitanii]PSU89798.1 hypothetical protein C9J27_24255 [Photobacterium kishitanii]
MAYKFFSDTCAANELNTAFKRTELSFSKLLNDHIYPCQNDALVELGYTENHDKPLALYYLHCTAKGNEDQYLSPSNKKIDALEKKCSDLNSKRKVIQQNAKDKALTLKTKKCISCGETVKTDCLNHQSVNGLHCPCCSSTKGFPFNKGDITKLESLAEKTAETQEQIKNEEITLVEKLSKKKNSGYEVRIVAGTWIHCDGDDSEDDYDY